MATCIRDSNQAYKDFIEQTTIAEDLKMKFTRTNIQSRQRSPPKSTVKIGRKLEPISLSNLKLNKVKEARNTKRKRKNLLDMEASP